MLTEVFNKHVEEILCKQSTELDELCMAAHALSGNKQMMIIGCTKLIELCDRIGSRNGLALKFMANNTLVKKAKEYSMQGDRLANFKERYAWQDQWSEGRLLGYLEKHIVSCADILSGQLEATEELLIEKFGDTMNYSILLYALLNEEEHE